MLGRSRFVSGKPPNRRRCVTMIKRMPAGLRFGVQRIVVQTHDYRLRPRIILFSVLNYLVRNVISRPYKLHANTERCGCPKQMPDKRLATRSLP